MGKYDVEYKKLAVLLLPMCLRKGTLTALLNVLTIPLQGLSERFAEYRRQKDIRLNHNGQVCFLRGVLNDQFDKEQRRIRVEDNESTSGGVIIEERGKTPKSFIWHMPKRIYRRGWEVTGGIGFVVEVPEELRPREQELRSIVNEYKLASMRYLVKYMNI